MSTGSKPRKTLIGCLVTFLIGGVLVIVLLIYGLHAFVNFGMASDIKVYITKISTARIDPAQKNRLIARLTKMRRAVKKGHHVAVSTWIVSDEKFRKILQDKTITEPEYKKFNNELDYLQDEADRTNN